MRNYKLICFKSYDTDFLVRITAYRYGGDQFGEKNRSALNKIAQFSSFFICFVSGKG